MYTPTEVDNLVHRKINEYFSTNRTLCNIGWVSLPNPGIKYRPKYLNSFNFPTKIDEIDYISQFSREADIDTVRKFYRQTNGMRLLSDKFYVPGVLFHRPDFENNDFDCVALDFSSHGGFLLPKFSPENGLLIGTSQLNVNGIDTRIYDIMTKNGSVVGGCFDKNSNVTSAFSSIEEWLSYRIDAAASELKDEISKIY